MNWPWTKSRSPVAEAYLAAARNLPSRKQAVDDLKILVLDAETTGFDVHKDRILSVALIEVRAGEILVGSGRNWTVFQPKVTANEAMRVHGILPSETAGGLPERDVMGDLLPLIGGALIVGHHIRFDIAMLNQAMQTHFNIRLRGCIVDTALLAMQELEAFRRTGYPNQHPPALDEVCAQVGIVPLDRHTAMGDAFTTAELLLFLLARLHKRLNRPVRLADIPSERA